MDRTRNALPLLIASALLASGCSESPPDRGLIGPRTGGQFGEETSFCAPLDQTPVDLGADPRPLGIDVASLVASVEGIHSGAMEWVDSSSEGTIEISHDGVVEIWTQGLGEEGTPSEICPDVLMVAVDVLVETADGRLGEDWSVALYASGDQAAYQTFSIDGFDGSLDVSRFAPEQLDTIERIVSLSFSAGVARLQIEGAGEKTDGDLVSFHRFDVGTLVAGEPD